MTTLATIDISGLRARSTPPDSPGAAVRWRVAGGRWQPLTPITRRASIAYPVIAARSVLVP